MVAYRVWYSGRVQGVGFRYSVKQIAAEFEVSGTVQNLSDGRVELMVQGEEAECRGMLDAIQDSHLHGLIHDRDEVSIGEDLEMRGFAILR
ncbi:MAG: acylphosphatase [Verrucomicrobiota bacterium]